MAGTKWNYGTVIDLGILFLYVLFFFWISCVLAFVLFSRFSSGIYYILVLWALILHGFWHVGVTKLSFIAWYSLQNLVIFRGIWYFLAVRALILHGFLHVLVNDLSFFNLFFAQKPRIVYVTCFILMFWRLILLLLWFWLWLFLLLWCGCCCSCCCGVVIKGLFRVCLRFV